MSAVNAPRARHRLLSVAPDEADARPLSWTATCTRGYAVTAVTYGDAMSGHPARLREPS